MRASAITAAGKDRCCQLATFIILFRSGPKFSSLLIRGHDGSAFVGSPSGICGGSVGHNCKIGVVSRRDGHDVT